MINRDGRIDQLHWRMKTPQALGKVAPDCVYVLGAGVTPLLPGAGARAQRTKLLVLRGFANVLRIARRINSDRVAPVDCETRSKSSSSSRPR